MNPQRIVIGVLALAAVVLVVVVAVVPSLKPTPLLSGYIEGEALYLAAPVAGQLTAVDVVRGQRVAAGSPVFVIDTRILTASSHQASGQVRQAASTVAAARASHAQLAAQVAVARADAAQADREAVRSRRTFAAGTISQQDMEKARTAAETAHASLAAAERQARAGEAQIAAAGGQLGQAEGAKADALARLSQAAPTAPAPARVEDVFYQVGEWAAANQPVVSLLPDDRVRLRFFVPERQVARYRVGQIVRFQCDGCGSGLTARINYVSPRPEFTPPVIYSLQSRDRLVFLVEALPADPRRLTPGLPADVIPLGP
ncbi:MAG TPA: HlyD family efflux transporter periplasmic adaptor subunit [Caulobacteraceae bacterium]|jgi:HlyD family secretion protein